MLSAVMSSDVTFSKINTYEYIKSRRFTVKKRKFSNFLCRVWLACFLQLSCASHRAANWAADAAMSATKVLEGEQEGPTICSHPASKLIQIAV